MFVTKRAYPILDNTMEEQEQEKITEETLVSSNELITVIDKSESVPIELDLENTLNINPNLKADDLEHLVTMMKQHKWAFAWEYRYMRGIPLALFT